MLGLVDNLVVLQNGAGAEQKHFKVFCAISCSSIVSSQFFLVNLAGGTFHSLGRNPNYYLSVPLYHLFCICSQMPNIFAMFSNTILHFTMRELSSPSPSFFLHSYNREHAVLCRLLNTHVSYKTFFQKSHVGQIEVGIVIYIGEQIWKRWLIHMQVSPFL